MPKVSVVIPVYKVGKYIENSIKSIIYQEFTDFEVIIVDNNTPDDSIIIAESLLSKTSIPYRVVKQPKQGLPAARNMGISASKGEWIISIDPDDTVSPIFLNELYNCATHYGLDIVFSKYNEIGPGQLFVFPEEAQQNTIELITQEVILKELLVRRMPLMVSNMFFNREAFIATGLCFDERVVLGADLILMWELLARTEKIAYINKCLYNHFDRPDSLMTAPSDIKIQSNIEGYYRLKNRITPFLGEQFSEWIVARESFALISTIIRYGSKEMYYKYINSIYTSKEIRCLKSFPDRRIRILNLIYDKNKGLFYLINKALRRPQSKVWLFLSNLLHK